MSSAPFMPAENPKLTGPYKENDPLHEPLVTYAYLAGVTKKLGWMDRRDHPAAATDCPVVLSGLSKSGPSSILRPQNSRHDCAPTSLTPKRSIGGQGTVFDGLQGPASGDRFRHLNPP